jgi:hypothetical protein
MDEHHWHAGPVAASVEDLAVLKSFGIEIDARLAE